ncbi:sigma-70 family RNA polymerase sigma factor [Herbaspirillum autotrophicum]|uniref:sigma-70 family RNA polymerase sigma factor n=1 Tax=Herbaspirillum autotrophicum TaxID=180195 RepID=UPI00067DDC5B|nr:sigma-70 family RNA polymerase sigma factor [Herbaspirillum autotrophicum]
MTTTPTAATALFEASRRRLVSIAYRMLGSVSEAEDVVQETWMRWHATDCRQLQTPVAWLTTVATRLSIDRLRQLQRERLVENTHWLPEPWLDDCAPSAEDTVSRLSDLSYGVLLLLERLNPDERAALLLHEVFDCQYEEIARTLDKTPAHCRQLVRRGKERVQSGPARRITGEQVCERLVQDFLCAIRSQDKPAMLRLLAADAMVIGDGGRRSAPVAGLGVTQAAGRFIDTIAALDLSAITVTTASINGGWGATLAWRGQIVLTLSFEIDNAQISTLYAVARPCRSVPAFA